MVNGVLKQIDWVKRNSGKNSGISGNWPKNPEIPELSKWFGIAIGSTNFGSATYGSSVVPRTVVWLGQFWQCHVRKLGSATHCGLASSFQSTEQYFWEPRVHL